ncbi:hypothetical protein CHCC20335_1529 [Bacillus paralicheniformis]|nr:hypothetical protein CHCC20335_1529 [Bacillus paralicheniformis]
MSCVPRKNLQHISQNKSTEGSRNGCLFLYAFSKKIETFR